MRSKRLIEWLDSTIDCDQDAAVDDDPCDGDTDAEPSLGSFDRMSNQIRAWAVRFEVLVSATLDAEVDDSDDEPSLGSVDRSMDGSSQTNWTAGNGDDREGDGCADDREGDELGHGGESELEDSLGWTEEESARGRMIAGTMGRSVDLEDGPGSRQPQNRTVIHFMGESPSSATPPMKRLRRSVRKRNRQRLAAHAAGAVSNGSLTVPTPSPSVTFWWSRLPRRAVAELP